MPSTKRTPFALDLTDRKILAALQEDASRSLEAISREVGASKTPVWNRIRKMTEAGIIERHTVQLNPDALGLDTCFFVLVRTSDHSAEWQANFLEAVRDRPEVLEAHRLAGEIDYLLKVRVSDVHSYDHFYQALIARVRVHEVTALLSMEAIKAHAPLPLDTETDAGE